MKLRPLRPTRAILQTVTAIACALTLVINLHIAINRYTEIVDVFGYTLLWWVVQVLVILAMVGLIAGPTDYERAQAHGGASK